MDQLLSQPEYRDVAVVSREHLGVSDMSAAAQIARIKNSGAQLMIVWMSGTPLGTLHVNGVITQEFRGPVGTFCSTCNPPSTVSGYAKDYNYDTRLKYLSPPYFLSPTQSAWGRISYTELKPTSTP